MEATTTFSNSRGCSGTSVPAPVGCGIETETTPRCPAVTVATTSTRRKIPSSTATMTLTTHSRRYRELMTAAAASPHKKIPNMSVIVMQQVGNS